MRWAIALAVATIPASARADNEPLTVLIDWTLGFGKIQAVDSSVDVGTGRALPPARVDAQVGLTTFIVGAEYAFPRRISAGLRLPFTYGNFGNVVFEGGHAIAIGNVEPYVSWKKNLNKTLAIGTSFALALPSSLGTEPPEDLSAIPPDKFDNVDANKFSLNQAAAAAFGYEQDQLFWSKRFGLTPAVYAEVTRGKFRAEPFLKIVNLIDTHNASVEPYRLEIVFGAAAHVRVIEWFDLGLRAWGSASPARRAHSPIGAGVVAPEARVLFGENKSASVYVAGVLPFVGSNVDPYYFGAFRAGISGSF